MPGCVWLARGGRQTAGSASWRGRRTASCSWPAREDRKRPVWLAREEGELHGALSTRFKQTMHSHSRSSATADSLAAAFPASPAPAQGLLPAAFGREPSRALCSVGFLPSSRSLASFRKSLAPILLAVQELRATLPLAYPPGLPAASGRLRGRIPDSALQ